MYEVEFYEDANGVSELWDFLEELRVKSATNKDARIQHKQIALYIQLLQDSGTRLPENITKHLVEDIWELRPGNNRVFYFCWRKNKLPISWTPAAPPPVCGIWKKAICWRMSTPTTIFPTTA